MSFAIVLVLILMIVEYAPRTYAADSTGVVTLSVSGSSVAITEGDEPFEYSISLGSKPSASVWVATKVTMSSGKNPDTAHLRTKLLVEPSVITFEPDEWIGNTSPTKTLKLIAPEDYVAEETQRFYVEHVVASTASEYSMQNVKFLPQDKIEVEVKDNDQAAVAMTVSSFKSVGGMVKGAYAVGLRSEPLSPVAVMISSDGPVPITFDPSTIYFTRDQWHKPVQVRFEALNASKTELLSANVIHSSESLDTNYDHTHCKFLPADRFAPFEAQREVV